MQYWNKFVEDVKCPQEVGLITAERTKFLNIFFEYTSASHKQFLE